MLKQFLLATLVFIICVTVYQVYKHQVTKRAFKKASQDEALVLVYKGGVKQLPATNIPRNYPTMTGMCFSLTDDGRISVAAGSIYNITLTKMPGDVPIIEYYSSLSEALEVWHKVAQKEGR